MLRSSAGGPSQLKDQQSLHEFPNVLQNSTVCQVGGLHKRVTIGSPIKLIDTLEPSNMQFKKSELDYQACVVFRCNELQCTLLVAKHSIDMDDRLDVVNNK